MFIVGGDGVIGSALFSCLDKTIGGVTVSTRRRDRVSSGKRYLDLASERQDWGLSKPAGTIVICAGITSLEQCELDKNLSRKVNVEAAVEIAEWGMRNGSHVIYLSTNQVFDGSSPYPETDSPACAVSEYGRQKAEAERRILSLSGKGEVCILRLTKVLHEKYNLFVNWARKLVNNEPISAFNDMSLSPIPLASVITTILVLAQNRAKGIWHLSGERNITYLEAALIPAEKVGASAALVKSTSAIDGGLNKQPSYNSLGLERIKTEFGIVPPDVRWTVECVALQIKPSLAG